MCMGVHGCGRGLKNVLVHGKDGACGFGLGAAIMTKQVPSYSIGSVALAGALCVRNVLTCACMCWCGEV